MIDKLVNEFEIALEKEQTYLHHNDRRQVVLTFNNFLKSKLIQIMAEHHVDKHWYDQSDEEGKKKLEAYSKESNIIRLVSSLAGNNCLEEKIEKNKPVTEHSDGKPLENFYLTTKISHTLYVLKP